MSTIAKPNTFSAGQTIASASLNANWDTIYNDYNGSIANVNCASNMALVDTKLATISTTGKVNVSALTVSSQATGDILYASSSSAWARLGVGTASQTIIGGTTPSWATLPISAATQTNMEAGTDNTVTVTPLGVKWNPGVAKAWINFDSTPGTPVINASLNVSSLTDNGVGDITVNFTTSFSSANYCPSSSADNVGPHFIQVKTLATGTARHTMIQSTTGSAVDGVWYISYFGDQ